MHQLGCCVLYQYLCDMHPTVSTIEHHSISLVQMTKKPGDNLCMAVTDYWMKTKISSGTQKVTVPLNHNQERQINVQPML